MPVITINTGSTSVKLALFEVDNGGTPRQVHSEHHDEPADANAILQGLAARTGAALPTVVHRVVHGGTRFQQPTRLTPEVVAQLEQLSPLAPLHNPAALHWINAALQLWRAPVVQLAVFDTAFFASLPRLAAEYAVAKEIGTAIGVRRYGFHGLAHESLWRRWCELNPGLRAGGRLLTLQLGGGCSMAAIAAGKPVETSMGFSPLEGLVMATRCGDFDPAAVTYAAGQLDKTPAEIVALLESQSGLRGMAGRDARVGELLSGSDAQGRFAAELYCYRIRKYLGAYLAVLGGCDGIVFGGGVGVHEPDVRTRALSGLEPFGITLDPALNAAAVGGEARLSTTGARVTLYALPTNEEGVMARGAADFVASAR